jgi:NDP-sugar pyrophosphorylase family protein
VAALFPVLRLALGPAVAHELAAGTRAEGDAGLLGEAAVGALPRLTKISKLAAFQHEGFWQPMDTLREKNILSEYAISASPPWLDIRP